MGVRDQWNPQKSFAFTANARFLEGDEVFLDMAMTSVASLPRMFTPLTLKAGRLQGGAVMGFSRTGMADSGDHRHPLAETKTASRSSARGADQSALAEGDSPQPGVCPDLVDAAGFTSRAISPPQTLKFLAYSSGLSNRTWACIRRSSSCFA